MAWLYLADDFDALPQPGDELAITGAEAHHAAAVARIRVGEEIAIANGRGLAAAGPVVEASKDRVAIEVARAWTEEAPSPELWLVQALAKGDRDELAVQAATELGAAGIVPWQAARSVSRWNAEKADKGVVRWRSIAREAAKQSLRARIPEVSALRTTKQLAALAAEPGTVLVVLEPDAGASLVGAAAPGGPLAAAARICLVVGPEGGIAPEELEALRDAGALALRLGSPVLRTSTAGPAAIAALSALLGHWEDALPRGLPWEPGRVG